MWEFILTLELYLQPELEASIALNTRPMTVVSSLSVFVLSETVLLAESLTPQSWAIPEERDSVHISGGTANLLCTA